MTPSLLLGLAATTVVVTALVLVVRRYGRLRQDMPALDRAAWQSADSLAQVATLTAGWLAGELHSQPGYFGPVDVDEPDAPGMTESLIACNHTGFLTTGSQAGYDGTGYDGCRWQQLAAVDGLIADRELSRLRRAVAGTGIMIDASGHGQTVTRREDQACTTFGRRRRDLADRWTGYGMCGPNAVAELNAACPVVVYDPEPGRNDRLWPALARFADTRP